MNPEADQQDPEYTTAEPGGLEITAPKSLDPVSLVSETLNVELVDPVSVDPASVDLVALQAGAATGGDAGIAPAAGGLSPAGPAPAPATAKTAKPRAGVPVWRTGKPDAFLAAAADTARTAIAGITAASDIGRHLAVKSEGDRLVTHLFECRLPGYAGWQWFAVLTRNSRSKVVTVNELGLLPSEDSILAPEWVPWAERVRPEDEQEQESGEADAHQADTPEAAAAEPADGVAASLDAVGSLDGEGLEKEAPESEAREAEAGDAQRAGRDAVTD